MSGKLAGALIQPEYVLPVQRLGTPKASLPTRSPNERHTRSSFVHGAIVAWLGSVGLATSGVEILSIEKHVPAIESTYQLRVHDISNVIRVELNMTMVDRYSKHLNVVAEEASNDVPDLVEVIVEKACTNMQKFCSDPMTITQEGCVVAEQATQWVSHYRLPAKQMKEMDPAKLDCNDNSAFEVLSKYGLPMYIVSIWPKQPGHRLDHSWHQFAATKLNENDFLIVDGKNALRWHGSLQDYVSQQPQSLVPQEIIPTLGLSKHADAYFQNPISRGLVQLHHLIPSEDHMEQYYKHIESNLMAAQ